MSAAVEEEESSIALRRASDWAAQEEEERNGQPRQQKSAEEAAAAAAAAESEARHFALCLALEAGAEVQEIEESIDEMLIRLDEFCSMTDMIRSDTSQLLDEAIPLIKAKMIEMNNIYTKVDKLEAFVKMVGQHVSFLEEQVLQAEKAYAVVPYTVRKLFGSASVPLFNKFYEKVLQLAINIRTIDVIYQNQGMGDNLMLTDQKDGNAPHLHSTLTACQSSTELKTIFLSST